MAPGQRAPCRIFGDAQVTAAIFETTGGVDAYLGDRVVVLFGEPDLIRKALPLLRPLKEQAPALPPPPEWVQDQLRRCAPPSPETKLRELRAAGGPPVYWLERSFEGHPLVSAEGDAEEVRLVYGECARDELAFEAACWPPLEIQVRPLQSPAAYAKSIECRLGDAQGVPGALFPSAHTLDVFAGERTIRLIGPDLELLRRAAGALRPLDQSEPSGRLPAPPRRIGTELRARCT